MRRWHERGFGALHEPVKPIKQMLPDIPPGCEAVVAPSSFQERATRQCDKKNG